MKINTKRIEIMLVERKMTKSALAAEAGISRQNISTIIRRGICEPKTAGKLAAGLGVSVADIIGDGEEMCCSEKVCPIVKQCKGAKCAWWCEFAQECSIPLLAGMFVNSGICEIMSALPLEEKACEERQEYFRAMASQKQRQGS